MDKTPQAIKRQYGIDGLRTFRTMEAHDTDLDVLRRRNELWMEVTKEGWSREDIAKVAGAKENLVDRVISKSIKDIKETIKSIEKEPEKKPEREIKSEDLTPKEKVQ